MNMQDYPICSASLRDTSANKAEQSRSVPPNTCEICHKRLGSRKAYAGHMLLAHGKRVGVMAQMETMLQQAYDMQIAMSRRLDRLEQALAYVAARRAPDASDETLGAEMDNLGKWLRGEMSIKPSLEARLYQRQPKKGSKSS